MLNAEKDAQKDADEMEEVEDAEDDAYGAGDGQLEDEVAKRESGEKNSSTAQ